MRGIREAGATAATFEVYSRWGGWAKGLGLTGGVPQTLAAAQDGTQTIVVDATSVCWTNENNDTVMKLTSK